MTEAVKDVQPKYHANVLSSFENGALLDLRVKLAIDFLKSPMFSSALPAVPVHGVDGVAEVVVDVAGLAVVALDLATALLEVGAARGLVSPLPDHGEITTALRRHIERSVAAGAFQAQESNRAATRAGPILGVPHFNG